MRFSKFSILRAVFATALAVALLSAAALPSNSFSNLFALLSLKGTDSAASLSLRGQETQSAPSPAVCTGGWDPRFGTLATDGAIWALAQDGSGNLYAGGDFTAIGGISANGLAKWNGFAWSALGSGVNGLVTSIVVSGTDVFVAGDFTSAGGSAASRVARWDGSAWSALGTGVDDTVWALAVSGTDLFAGGEFLNAGGSAANRVARWNGASWTPMGTGANGPVWALRSALNGIVAGGSFTSAGGAGSTGGIARWNGSVWSALGSGFGSSDVHALTEDQGILYAGGRISSSGATALSNIASWNGTAWSPVGSGIPSSVVSLAASGGRIYASRDFREIIGTPSAPTLRWDGSSWTEIGTGTDSPVNALLVGGGSVYAGGFFNLAGCQPSARFARFFENSFSGSAGGDWHTSGNWSNGSIPNATSSAVIKDTDVSITSSDASVLDLQVEGGRTITVAAGRTLTVSGALILNGTISGAGTVEVLNCNANAVARDSGGSGKMTVALKRCVAPGGDFLFPTGGASGYSPVRLSNVVGQSTFTVKVAEQAYSATTDLPANRLGRYWDLTNAGITSADVTFFYNASDITSGTEANYKVFRISGTSAVNVGGTTNTSTRSATVTGVTSFSPWTLAEPPADCSYSITPSSTQSIGASGGVLNISVTAMAGCAWNAVSDSPWITVHSGAGGNGNGSVVLTVSANGGGLRSGSVIIGGLVLTIQQAAGGSITGTVRYHGGTRPAVAGVTLTASGSQPLASSSGLDGSYTLRGFGQGPYTVVPTKSGDVNGIASADAARVAQAVVGLVTLTASQQIAADATGNGAVASADAARIAQYIVGLNPAGATGTWKFAPYSRTYGSIDSNVTGEDYDAIMVGDVTGNWTAPVSTADYTGAVLKLGLPGLFGSDLFAWGLEAPDRGKAPGAPISVAMDGIPEARSGEVISTSIQVGDLTSLDVTAFDVEISYDPSALRPIERAPARSLGTMTANFAITVNTRTPGRLRVSGYGIAALSGSGDLLQLSFEVVDGRLPTVLQIDRFVFNEGEIPILLDPSSEHRRRDPRRLEH